MDFKNLSKAQLIEMIAKKEIELNEKNELIAKNQKPKKAKFDNIIIIKAAFNELMNVDDDIFIELKAQLSLLNSIGDKWNYYAFLHKALIFIQKNKINIQDIKLKFNNAGDEFAISKLIFNNIMKIEKNINIPDKDKDYNSMQA